MTEESRAFLMEAILSAMLEDVQQGSIIDAVSKRHKATIRYDGGGDRLVDPVAYGVSEPGNLVVRAYQEGGESKSGKNGWKLFRSDKIDSWETEKDTVFNEPPGYDPENDRGMATVYVSADFGNGNAAQNNTYGTGGAAGKELQNTGATPPPKAGEDIAGVPERGTEKRQAPTWRELKAVSNFGDSVSRQTNGPVRKGDKEQVPQESGGSTPKYGQIASNGPQYKGKEQAEGGTEETEDIGAIDSLDFVDDEDREENV